MSPVIIQIGQKKKNSFLRSIYSFCKSTATAPPKNNKIHRAQKAPKVKLLNQASSQEIFQKQKEHKWCRVIEDAWYLLELQKQTSNGWDIVYFSISCALLIYDIKVCFQKVNLINNLLVHLVLIIWKLQTNC